MSELSADAAWASGKPQETAISSNKISRKLFYNIVSLKRLFGSNSPTASKFGPPNAVLIGSFLCKTPGELLFDDGTGQIRCVLLHPNLSHFGGFVCLLEWKFCKTLEGNYLEILDCFQSLGLRELAEFQVPFGHLAKLRQQCNSVYASQYLASQDTYNIAGQVMRKSTLLVGKNALVFVAIVKCQLLRDRLDCKSYQVPVFFSFSNAEMLTFLAHYLSLEVMGKYQFSSLKTSKVQFGRTESSRYGLSFVQSSAFSPVHDCFLDVGDIGMFSQLTLPAEVDDNQHLISYEGVITKIVDVELGIYELDGMFLLYTTFYSGPEIGMAPKCSIAIHNVHLVHSELLQNVCLVACSATTIVIMRFSPDNTDKPCRLQTRLGPPSFLKHKTFFSLWAALQVRERLDEMRMALDLRIDPTEGSKQVLAHVTTQKFVRKPYDEVLEHSKGCMLIRHTFEPFKIVTLKALTDIVRRKCDEKGKVVEKMSWRSLSLGEGELFDDCRISLLIVCELDQFGLPCVKDETGHIALIDTDYLLAVDGLYFVHGFDVHVDMIDGPVDSTFAADSLMVDKSKLFLSLKLKTDSVLRIFSLKRESILGEGLAKYYFWPRMVGGVNLECTSNGILPYIVIQGDISGEARSLESTADDVSHLFLRCWDLSLDFINQLEINCLHLLNVNFKRLKSVGTRYCMLDIVKGMDVRISRDADRSSGSPSICPVHLNMYTAAQICQMAQELNFGEARLVSMQGKITSKRLVPSDAYRGNQMAETLFTYQSDHGLPILSGFATVYTIDDGASGIELCFSTPQPTIVLPHFLNVGQHFLLENLLVKMGSGGKPDVSIAACTRIRLTVPPHPKDSTPPRSSEALVTLTMLEACTKDLSVFSALVDVIEFMAVHVRFACSNCHSLLASNSCINDCANPGRKMLLKAAFLGDDGTMQVKMSTSRSEVLFKLLLFNDSEIREFWDLVNSSDPAELNANKYTFQEEQTSDFVRFMRQIAKDKKWIRSVKINGSFADASRHALSKDAASYSCLVPTEQPILKSALVKDIHGKHRHVAALGTFVVTIGQVEEVNTVQEAHHILARLYTMGTTGQESRLV